MCASRLARAKSLHTHLSDWECALRAKGNTIKDIKLKTRRVRKMLRESGATSIKEITVGRITAYLAGLREKGLSRQTSNHYLQAVKQFLRWARREGRASENPLEHASALNARVDQRRTRCALTPAECRRLLQTTKGQPRRHGMAGPERALLYQIALETGLRASELRSLTRVDFDLSSQPSVTVRASNAKNRRESTIPLRNSTAADLAKQLISKTATDRVFSMPDSTRTARMLKKDLAAAGIDYRDPAGRYRDFHALRHTFITSLATSGVHPKTAQTLARHSDIRLTLDRYTQVLGEQQVEAINALPDLSSADPVRRQA